MCDKRNNVQPNKWNPSTEINTRNDGVYESYNNHSHVNASVESNGTTPIDISLMTGNGQPKEGE